MNDEKLCDMFHKEYRAELETVERLYRQYQFQVAAIVVLAGAIATLTHGDLLDKLWTRVDVFLYYTFCGLAAGFLFAAAVCLVLSLRPRKFQQLDDLEKWWKWRIDYRAEVVASGFGDGDSAKVDAAVGSVSCERIIERLAQAADWNALQNRTKLKWFHYAYYLIAGAIGSVTLQAIMHAVLFMNQVKGGTP